MESVKLIECINTWQGEGPDMGQRMLLLRFKHCNLNCSWCDTKVKMRALQEATYDLENIQNIINNEKCGLMITGGEPTFKPHIEDTLKLLRILRYNVANIETNGFRIQELIQRLATVTQKVRFIYSPKVYTMDEFEKEKNVVNNVFKNTNVYIKYVIGKEDINSAPVIEFLKFITSFDYNNRIFLMPKGETKDELMESAPTVFDLAEEYKVNFSSRSHIIYDFV